MKYSKENECYFESFPGYVVECKIISNIGVEPFLKRIVLKLLGHYYRIEFTEPSGKVTRMWVQKNRVIIRV